MNGLAALLALALVQSPDAEPAPAPAPAATQEASPPAAEAPAPERAPSPLAPAPPPPQPAPPASDLEPKPPPPAPAATPRRRRAPASTPSPAPDAGPAAAPLPAAAPSTKEAKPSPDRVQVAAAAAKFFQALLSRRPGEIAALCAPAFSFEGKVVAGADPIRSRWVEVVASRDDASYALLDMEILSATDAQARYGKPPKRLAALAGPGAWVALANVSGRPTFVFFARQGAAWLATGMHD